MTQNPPAKYALARTALRALTFLSVSLALAAPSAAAGVVNVYSERQPVFLEKVFERFTAATGIEVRTLFAKKGLIDRMKLEGDASPADVIMVADVGRLDLLKREGVTREVDDPALLANIPSAYRDPDGHWFGVTRRARVLFVGKDSGLAGDPITYERLGSPDLGGTICMRPGTHPYNVALISAHIAHHGEDATLAWLEGIKGNLGRDPQGNDRAQITAVVNGECDYAIANNYYYYKMQDNPEQREIAEKVTAVFPRFEGGGIHVNLSGYALAKHSPNRENALALMRFLTEREAQLIYAEENGEFPVLDGIGIGGDSAEPGLLDPDGVPAHEIAGGRAAASRLVEESGLAR